MCRRRRLTFRGQEDGHRPAAVAGEGSDRLHVEGVHVGALLAIHLDVHEEPVHEFCHRGVLEGFVCHDVAPVARGVPHRQQHGLVPAAGLVEGFGSPGVPVHRVVGVLAEVRAALGGKTVHAPSIGAGRCSTFRAR